MHYKGKVIDTATAPLTSTGTDCKASTHFAYTDDDNATTMHNDFTNEDDKKGAA